jgi:hypothetical protein
MKKIEIFVMPTYHIHGSWPNAFQTTCILVPLALAGSYVFSGLKNLS